MGVSLFNSHPRIATPSDIPNKHSTSNRKIKNIMFGDGSMIFFGPGSIMNQTSDI